MFHNISIDVFLYSLQKSILILTNIKKYIHLYCGNRPHPGFSSVGRAFDCSSLSVYQMVTCSNQVTRSNQP